MGQTQSETYECESDEAGEQQSPRDSRGAGVADKSLAGSTTTATAPRPSKRTTATGLAGKLNRKGNNCSGGGGGGNQGDNQTNAPSKFHKAPLTASDRMTLERQHRHVRKLSNVSNRNIQLLSIKPRNETDTYAEGLRSRRRSSLINLILGAPSRGPRFSEDLCSLSSHTSELCNFGIDYFPDITNNGGRHLGSLSTLGSSSLACLEEGSFVKPVWGRLPATATVMSRDGSKTSSVTAAVVPPFGPHIGSRELGASGEASDRDLTHLRRRRSSLGSLTSFEVTAAAARSQVKRPIFNLDTDTNRHNPFEDEADSHYYQCSGELEGGAQKTSTTASVKTGDHQAQQGTTQMYNSSYTSSSNNDPMSSSISSFSAHHHAPHQHQLGARQRDQEAGARRGGGAPSLSSMCLASVDLTSSFEGDSGASGGPIGDDTTTTNGHHHQLQQQRQLKQPPKLASSTTSGRRRVDYNQNTNAGQEGGYYFNGRVGVENKKTTPVALMESWRDSGCSQDSASLSSSCTNLGTATGTSSTAAQPTTTNESEAVGSLMASDKGAPPPHTAADGTRAAAAFAAKGRINHAARRMIHRSGSELSLYSTTSSSLSHNQQLYYQHVYPRHISRGSIASVMLEAGGGAAGTNKKGGGGEVVSSSVLGSGIGAGGLAGSPALYSPHQSVNDRAPSLPLPPTTTTSSHLHETKLIIMLQVCLPFILAGFGNMGAGLVLNQIAHWEAFRSVPIFFVLLPSFVGLKGNIEMTLASRLSTLSNLNLLDTSYQRRRALVTNLILILSQAIGLSLFAAIASVACEFSMGKLHDENVSNILNLSTLIVLPAALVTSITLVMISSIVMWFAIWLAKRLQVNPDNLSTLMAALYGDVSCVLTYGLFAQLMYSLNQQGVLIWPVSIIGLALVSWPLLWYAAYQAKETHELALSSMPPMLAAIMVSLGSGAVLSLVVDKFSRVALYQPVVNGFGANLIAVQASRVSTWLWCSALRRLSAAQPVSSSFVPSQPQPAGPLQDKCTKEFGFEFESNNKMPYGSLASFVELPGARRASIMSKQQTEHKAQSGDGDGRDPGGIRGRAARLATKLANLAGGLVKLMKLLLWSFCNSSPNAVAARLLLVMLIPAHSLYFIVIWLVAPAHYISLTWSFYIIYIVLCLIQVFLLLTICQPLMTFLMYKHLDPDIFGISLLMALADLIGTLCLTGAFYLLERIGDPNAF